MAHTNIVHDSNGRIFIEMPRTSPVLDVTFHRIYPESESNAGTLWLGCRGWQLLQKVLQSFERLPQRSSVL